MNAGIDTDRLIQILAGEAGTGLDGAPFGFGRWLLAVAALALAVAVALVFLVFGISDALPATVRSIPFHHKLASTLALACGGFFLVRAAARPAGTASVTLALLPGAAVLAIGGVLDTTGLPVLGESGISVPICLGAIILLSLPALGLIVAMLRTGAPTRPSFAGAAAGLLAGSLGAAAYALACKNDGGLFVAVWYSAAILIVAGLGAVIGRRALAW
jgi:hypothetical protein